MNKLGTCQTRRMQTSNKRVLDSRSHILEDKRKGLQNRGVLKKYLGKDGAQIDVI